MLYAGSEWNNFNYSQKKICLSLNTFGSVACDDDRSPLDCFACKEPKKKSCTFIISLFGWHCPQYPFHLPSTIYKLIWTLRCGLCAFVCVLSACNLHLWSGSDFRMKSHFDFDRQIRDPASSPTPHNPASVCVTSAPSFIGMLFRSHFTLTHKQNACQRLW